MTLPLASGVKKSMEEFKNVFESGDPLVALNKPYKYVDIPICDPYRNKMKDHISGIKNSPWENKEFFEGYVQFKNYMGFTKCMDVLRDMKLVHKSEEEAVSVDMKVDFDRSKHLSDASIRRREIVRDRLVAKQRQKEENERNELEEIRKKEMEEKKKELSMKQQKEQRRKIREEKRKAVILDKLKIKGADEINAKIAKEEKKLLKVQRRLESIRLIEELFRRIKEKRESEPVNAYSYEAKVADNELRRYKNTSELEVLNQKQKLHNAIQGRVMLKTVLQGDDIHNYSSSSSEDELQSMSRRPLVQEEIPHLNGRLPPTDLYEQPPLWYGYPYMPHVSALYQPPVRGHPAYNILPLRGRGVYGRGQHYPGPSRGSYFNRRSRGYRSQYRGGYHLARNQYTPEMEEEYLKYFSKFLHTEHDTRERSRSLTRRSRSRSYSRNRSYSRTRSYSRSLSINRRSKSRCRSRRSNSRGRRSVSRGRRSNSRSRRSNSRSRRSKSRSRSRRSVSKSRRSASKSRRSVSRTRRSRSRYRKSRSHSGSRSSMKANAKDRSHTRNESSRSKRAHTLTTSPGRKKATPPRERKSKSPSVKSVDSSKFISPNRMRKERSKSWSLPKDTEKERRDSWSRSPEQKK